MSYTAVAIQANDIIPHSNADKLNLLRYNGMQFVISKDILVGDTVILFPTDGQLSHDFCHYNNLYRDASKNKNTLKSGFFEDNRRVRAQPFRKERSFGFVATPDMFEFTGQKEFSVGDEFDKLNGYDICNKYYTPKTLAAMARVQNKKVKHVEYLLKEHVDSIKWEYHKIKSLGEKSLVIISEKIHGTSARTGYVQVIHRLQNIFQKLFTFIFRRFIGKEVVTYEYVTGTRRTIANDRLDITSEGQQDSYRWDWHKKISPMLHKGEAIYYEIVGYDSLGGTIMETQQLGKLKDVGKINPDWNNPMKYTYGLPEGNNDVYVYRITRTTEDGTETELDWFQVEQRCRELGVKTVPVLQVFLCEPFTEENENILDNIVQTYMNDSSSTLDGRHLMEGIVIRVENSEGTRIYKNKNYLFGILEGYLKENDGYIDQEEIN